MLKSEGLGARVRDVVTGFEGITTARCEYLNGCVQYCVTPTVEKDKPGTYPEARYIDCGQLELIAHGAVKDTESPSPVALVGGPQIATPPTTYRG